MLYHRILRCLTGLPPPSVSREQALQIAIHECERLHLCITNPVVIEELSIWAVWIDSESSGSPVILVSNQTGAVLGIRTIPR